MKLDVVRTQFGKDATNGMLFIDGVFECFTLEDEVRDVKVHSETAIPLGEYEIKLRTEGGFHSKYTARYGAMHKGMLWLQEKNGNITRDKGTCMSKGSSSTNRISVNGTR